MDKGCNCSEDYCNDGTIVSADEYVNPWMVACIILTIIVLSFCLFYIYKKMKNTNTPNNNRVDTQSESPSVIFVTKH